MQLWIFLRPRRAHPLRVLPNWSIPIVIFLGFSLSFFLAATTLRLQFGHGEGLEAQLGYRTSFLTWECACTLTFVDSRRPHSFPRNKNEILLLALVVQRFFLVECLRFDMSAAARLFTDQRTAVSCREWARARASSWVGPDWNHAFCDLT
jgi:hypothetical protein